MHTPVQLSSHTFPHEVRHPEVAGHIVLYAEKGRSRATYRYYGPDGARSSKQPVPEALGAAAQYANTSAGDTEAGVTVPRVPDLMIRWAYRHLERAAIERLGGKAERPNGAGSHRPNHVRLGTVFERLRQSAWYRKLAVENRRRLLEVDMPMRWVESVLGSGFVLSRWDANTLMKLEQARTRDGILTTTFEGEPTWREPCGFNTYAGDMRIIKQVFAEALEVSWGDSESGWLLDVNPMDRVQRKLPRAKVRRPREVIDEDRYQALLSVADEIDPTGRFRFFLLLLRWTGRRVSTVLRMTRNTVLLTEQEVRDALLLQKCRYVPPHRIGQTAKLYAENGASLYVRWWMVKGGQQGEEGKAEQYDAVHPVHPLVTSAIHHYFSTYWEKLGLGPSDPLFPSGRKITRRMSNEQVYDWFGDAARMLGDRGTPLGMTSDNAYHGLRYNRRTELHAVNVKYARWLCEHSVLSGTPGITVSEGVYQGLIPAELVRAVRTDPSEWESE